MEPKSVIHVGSEHADRMRRIAVFYQLGTPGMTLLGDRIAGKPPKRASDPPPAPLPTTYGVCHYFLESGEECGRRISRNKTRCGPCYLAALKGVAESLTPELLDEYVKDMPPLDRLEVMGMIRPFLKFAA